MKNSLTCTIKEIATSPWLLCCASLMLWYSSALKPYTCICNRQPQRNYCISLRKLCRERVTVFAATRSRRQISSSRKQIPKWRIWIYGTFRARLRPVTTLFPLLLLLLLSSLEIDSPRARLLFHDYRFFSNIIKYFVCCVKSYVNSY